MKLRSFFSTLAAGVILFLLVGCAGFNQNPLKLTQGGTANPTAAIFVPKQSPAIVSLLVNPERLENFVQLVASPKEKGRAREELNKFKQSFLTNTGLDYRQDVKPWLGDEITLAVTSLDFDRNPQNGQQPGYLLALTTKDANKSREFLQLYWQKQALTEADLVFEQYQGVKLIYSNQQSAFPTVSLPKGYYNSQPIDRTKASVLANFKPGVTKANVATAVVGDRFVLFANHPKVLRDAINNVQAVNLNISDDASYQKALQNLTESRISLAFVNLPALSGKTSNLALDDTESIQKGYESIAIALSLNKQGILAQTALISSPSPEISTTEQTQAVTPTLVQPVAALQYLPENSAFVAASTNLQQFWSQLTEALATNNTLKQLVNQPIAALQSEWGIDLPKDIFSWVEGEYALAMLPRSDRNNPDWIFVTEKSDKAASAIENLDTVAKQRGLSVGSLPLEDRNISAWTKLTTAKVSNEGDEEGLVALKAIVRGVHATAGNYEIFTTSVEAMDRAFKATKKSLLNSSNFKNAIAPLPTPNDGYVYLDWQASQTLLERQLPILKVVEIVAKPLFDNLRSLTISSYGKEAGIQRSQLFFQLGVVDK